MLQFYFLSVLLNALTGIVLVFATDFLSKDAAKNSYPSSDDDFMFEPVDDTKSDSDKTQFFGDSFLDDMTFRLVLGILTAFMGFMKLFVSLGGSYPVLDDLLPALAGIAGGFLILIEYLVVNRDDIILPDPIETVCTSGRTIVGYYCIGAAVIHFVLPRLVFV